MYFVVRISAAGGTQNTFSLFFAVGDQVRL